MAPPFDPKSANGSTSFTGVANSGNKSSFVQMQMAIVKLGSDWVRFFFDLGCSKSYITSKFAKKLRLKTVGKEVISNGRFGDAERRTHTYPCVELSVPTHSGSVPLSLLVTDTIACPITRVPIDPKRYPIFKKVPLADPPPRRAENVNIDVLVGNDQYYQFVERERIELSDGLFLLDSKLGYITSGLVHDVDFDNLMEPSYFSALLAGSTSVSFQNVDLERFWSLEDIGVKDDSYIKDDELALQRFNESIRFDGKRYEVGWPWKSEDPDLPSNYDLALSRLKSLSKRLNTDPELLQTYDRTIRDQITAGVVEEVPNDNISGKLVHYLPHHCVVKPDRATTKVRIVYDGSAKSARSLRSLNESLLRGPVFLQDLCGMLLRFRSFQFAVTADIEKAFLQVALKPDDRDVTRFLWLKDPAGPVDASNLIIFRFCRVLFGIISSPFLLDATIKHYIHQSQQPMAKVIAGGIYVDNLICGAPTEQQCREIFSSAKTIFSENGMNIREWNSNSTDLMGIIPKSDHSQFSPLKVLGLTWDPKADHLSCSVRPVSAKDVTTKRHLVSASSKVFDPCGFVSPVVLQAKLLVQELWVRKIKWEQPLPSDVYDKWQIVAECLASVSDPKIDRFFGYAKDGGYIIHCFCDASSKAYTGVVYIQSSPVSIPKLLFSKAKLAPTKPVTMPRLELMGVVIGCRMTHFVLKQLGLKSATVTVWSDSKCVLQWLQSNKVLSVFVENRVRQIQEFGFQQRYVPTGLNPADISSRGCTIDELKASSLWWNGPEFLTQPQSSWPLNDLGQTQHTDPAEEAETSLSALALSNTLDTILTIENFSSLLRLPRVTAWVLRFVSKLRGRTGTDSTKEPTRLSASELQSALDFWIRAVQSSTLTPSGINRAKLTNLWKKLGVFVDPAGLYRCRDRLQNSSLPETAKFPILLPKNHHLTTLIVRDAHSRNMHAGPSHTKSILLQTYWIPQMNSLVKSVIHKCLLRCKFEGGPFALPAFPPLPPFRVQTSRPFESVGIDYFGPLYLSVEEGSSKVWVCLFTCATSRAIHLEVVTDLSTDQFLLAFRRFIAAYETPHTIISDNAKHFKLANNFFQRLWTEILNCDEVQQFAANQGINWAFIPEYAPWMGGFYERLVGTVKRSLKKVLGRQTFTLVQLQTVIAEVCSVVNTRPLVASTDVGGPVLTPADLLGKSKCFPAQQAKTYDFLTFDAQDNPDKTVRFGPAKTDDLLRQWKDSRNCMDKFWQCWNSDYLTSLRDLKTQHKESPLQCQHSANPSHGTSPLARFYSKHQFYVGAQLVTSVAMGAAYMILVCHGMQDLADELVNHPGLLNNSIGIPAWLEQVEFRKEANANIMIHIDQIYYAVAKAALFAPQSKVLEEFERFRRDNPPGVRIHFVMCSRNEYVFGCGTSKSSPNIDNPDAWPGLNVYGEILTDLYGEWAFGDEGNTYPTITQLFDNPGMYGSRYEHAVVILSDSQSRRLESVEYGKIFRQTGATFSHLAGMAAPDVLKASKYIILVTGTNMTRDSWSTDQWESDWRRMRVALRPVLSEGSDHKILINGPVWNPDPRARRTREFSEFMSEKAAEFDNVFFFPLWDPQGNPFVKTDAQGVRKPDKLYHDGDKYHVNKDGYLLFWRRWCFTFPELGTLGVKLNANHIWVTHGAPHVQHSVNSSIQA